VPCGIADRRATSLEGVLGRAVSVDDVRERLAARFGEVFAREMIAMGPGELRRALDAAAAQKRESEVILGEAEVLRGSC
jgi:lipoate-protein ligase B